MILETLAGIIRDWPQLVFLAAVIFCLVVSAFWSSGGDDPRADE